MGKRRHIQLYRTDIIGRRPMKSKLEYGEIAVNYSDGGEKLFIKNTSDEVVTFISEKEGDERYQPAGEYLTEHQDISGKADKATTLEGYGIADAYTKTETEGYVTAQIDNLVNGAPEAMDTLKELADAIGENETVLDGLNNIVNGKADAATTLAGYGITDAYTKTEADGKFLTEHQDVSGKADAATTLAGYGITDAYTKTEADGKFLTEHQDISALATKTEVANVSAKADANESALAIINGSATTEGSINKALADAKAYTDTEVAVKANSADVYTKTEADGKFLTEHQDISGKADKATTLEGYGIADAYTKTETEGYVTAQIDNLVNGAPEAMDTLKELADAIGENETIIDGLNNLVNEKANIEDVYDKEDIDSKVEALQKNIDEIDLGEYEGDCSRFVGHTQNEGEQYSFTWNGHTAIAQDGEEIIIVPKESVYGMFSSCSNLTSLDVSNWNTSKVTDMRYMFTACSNLRYITLGDNFDTSKVTDMTNMFSNCRNLTSLDVSNWNTSNVTNMYYMFYNCLGLTTLDVSNWNTSNVEKMVGIFNGCSGLTSLDVSNWDTSNVTEMYYMFDGCSKLRYITLGENFFKTTQTVSFDGATNLGFNEDSTDNGWLEHLATTAPQITDGQSRTIRLRNNIKNASWSSSHIATLQSKGYTIA